MEYSHEGTALEGCRRHQGRVVPTLPLGVAAVSGGSAPRGAVHGGWQPHPCTPSVTRAARPGPAPNRGYRCFYGGAPPPPGKGAVMFWKGGIKA